MLLIDAKHPAWIVSGHLDERYGMWAPQAFPRGRIAGLLVRLKALAPGGSATEFPEARWLLQKKDYEAAEPILAKPEGAFRHSPIATGVPACDPGNPEPSS